MSKVEKGKENNYCRECSFNPTLVWKPECKKQTKWICHGWRWKYEARNLFPHPFQSTPMTGKFLTVHSENHLSRVALILQVRELIGNALSETAYTVVSCVLPDLSMINRMTFILCIVNLLDTTNQFQMWLWNSSQCSNKLWKMDWRWHVSCALLAICVLNMHMFFTSKYSHIESGWTENPPERCSVKVCT